ncbi:hypothetical protein [Kineosporia sp. NBRC 101731]|uniref:hypothetical protein n=1 Tax=Kineosporia sp. NBRC 101731 TaxID=3032199 RepID=UPI0024A30858|nr:hypothetical protein [Kineosporia sp. NBRC 101731]GLY30681.1 hypothetical protein Kisp02_40460 [Kineosporia sp. NBRC 101731]
MQDTAVVTVAPRRVRVGTAWILLGVAVVAWIISGRAGLILMFGDRVVSGTWLALGLIAAAFAGLAGFPARRKHLPLVVALALPFFMGIAALTQTSFTTLKETGTDDCRIVVRESSLLYGGDGEFYRVGPGRWGIGRSIGTFGRNIPFPTFADGEYEMARVGGSVFRLSTMEWGWEQPQREWTLRCDY